MLFDPSCRSQLKHHSGIFSVINSNFETKKNILVSSSVCFTLRYLCLNILLFASLSIIKDRAYAKDVDEYVLSCLVMAVVFFHMIFIYIFVSRTNVPIKEMLEKDRLYDKELAKMKQRKSSRVVKVVAREIPPPLNWKWSQDSQESESRVSPTSRYEETNHLLPFRINKIR